MNEIFLQYKRYIAATLEKAMLLAIIIYNAFDATTK